MAPNLVVLTPGPDAGGVESNETKRVLTSDDEEDGEQLQVGDQVTKNPEEQSERTSRVRTFSGHIIDAMQLEKPRLVDN